MTRSRALLLVVGLAVAGAVVGLGVSLLPAACQRPTVCRLEADGSCSPPPCAPTVSSAASVLAGAAAGTVAGAVVVLAVTRRKG